MTGRAGSCFIHATALVVGECGILIEGPSGSGKSSLALALLRDAAAAGRFGRLVGDDRIGLTASHGCLVARPHPAIRGLIEQRGVGLIALAHEAACVLHLAVGLVIAGDTMPDRYPSAPAVRSLLGISLPWLMLPAAAGARDNACRVAASCAKLAALACLQPLQSAC